jgi:hypothetical protein
MPVKNATGSGKFLAGLKEAGVPEGVLRVSARIVSGKETGAVKIRGTLWLPTEREMFPDGKSTIESYTSNPISIGADERAENQAQLEYYGSNNVKYNDTNSHVYWLGSAYTSDWTFCLVMGMGITLNGGAASALGCAPAFCVW